MSNDLTNNIPQRWESVGYIFGIVTFALLLFYAGDTPHWRDASEFILGATFLDIAHPPGFATYSALGNVLTHTPLGPLTWRVHLFSALVTALGVTIVSFILRDLTAHHRIRSLHLGLISVAVIFPLFLSPAFVRQAVTAEGYQLNALFVLAVLWCGIRYKKSFDARFMYFGGFATGLGLGNHPSLILFVFPAFLILTPTLGLKRSLSALTFSFLGLLILLYLPIRAMNNPPLNTGEPTTIERLVNLLTDARDRHLRPIAINTIGSLEDVSIARQIEISRDDGKKIIDETGWYVAPLGALGLLAVFVTHGLTIGSLFLLAFGSVMFFFRGWQPDPMAPAFFVLAILAGFSLAHLTKTKNRAMLFGTFALLLAMTIPQFQKNRLELKANVTHKLPYLYGREMLESLPNHSAFVTETSWYLARQLQMVEGIRPDVVLSYVPHFLFPNYFKRPRNLIMAERFELLEGETPREPSFKNLGQFLSKASRVSPVLLEPAAATNSMLITAASVSSEGLLTIGKPTPIENFPEHIVTLGQTIQSLPDSYLRRDASSFLETKLLPLTDFLYLQSGDASLGVTAIQKACGPPSAIVCSDATHLKAVLYAAQSGEPLLAQSLYDEFVSSRGLSPMTKEILKSLQESSQ
ncbi:MAG: DUF2723 domain-containing protein [Bdellovibrionales bacterium]|nr:DUF2723 domain-containing protein [Bdellovibrionales bacterium]